MVSSSMEDEASGPKVQGMSGLFLARLCHDFFSQAQLTLQSWFAMWKRPVHT